MIERILITVGLVSAVLIIAALIRGAARLVLPEHAGRGKFFVAQATHLLTLAGIIAALLVMWRDNLGGIGTMAGWAAAGLTIALQRVVTAFAGYIIILRGNVFTVGDRIMIGGVRGDVVALGFMQTTVMEMGQSPGEMHDDPSMWIHGRQFSGRIVRVTNDKIFDTPVYNYTRDFPFIWDELTLPISYDDDYERVEQMMLDVARRHTAEAMRESAQAFGDVKDKYFLAEQPAVEPRVYVRMTDNWIELSMRFLTRIHGGRALKDAMSRELIAGLRAAKIGIASGTYAIVQVPTVNVRQVD